MKLTEVKHKHLLTDILKVLLFSIIMLVPILSVATRCLYVICNKNAYQSAEITQTTYNKQEINDIYQLNIVDIDDNYIWEENENEVFYFQLYSINELQYSDAAIDEVYIENKIIFNEAYLTIQTNEQNADLNISIGETNLNYINLYFLIEGGSLFNVDIKVISGDFEALQQNGFISATTNIYYDYEEVQATTLDNVFEYSVNKLNDNPLINWTQQTAIYTGVNTMTTQLGITNAVIPMLIVYWFLMTVIYIIIDIVIKLFTYLTHMIGNKTT